MLPCQINLDARAVLRSVSRVMNPVTFAMWRLRLVMRAHRVAERAIRRDQSPAAERAGTDFRNPSHSQRESSGENAV